MCNLVLVLGVAGLLAGCGNETTATPANLPTQIDGQGSVRGRVHFGGSPPEMKPLENIQCHAAANPIYDETVVVNPDGTLANVFVYLEGAPAVDGRDAEPALLDQVDCRYTPHIVGVQINQPLRIRSSDPTFHNVHYRPSRNRPGNFGQTVAGAENIVSFRHPEVFRVRCDVHPWMTAYIGVFDSPFFAATAESGTFEISGIPDGQYTLVAWHEKYGRLEQPVTVYGDEAVEVDFTYSAPTAQSRSDLQSQISNLNSEISNFKSQIAALRFQTTTSPQLATTNWQLTRDERN